MEVLEADDAKTFEILKDITSKCELCRRVGNAPRRFKVSMGQENTRINAEVYIYIMYLNGRPVLHLFDTATRFSAACFLPKVSTESVRACTLDCLTVLELTKERNSYKNS